MRPKQEVALIGAPAGAGAGHAGTREGPQALRSAGLCQALREAGRVVQDRGDLSGPTPDDTDTAAGYRHLRTVGIWCRYVHDAVASELSSGHLPVLLGGDHSLAIGSISATARHTRAAGQPLRVLWFDAHADCNSRRTSPSANLHGMPVACLYGIGPPGLTSLSGQRPALQAGQLHLIGVRSMDPGEAQRVHTLGLHVIHMATLRAQGTSQAMDRALEGLSQHARLHISLDLDVLDPGVAPGTGTPVADGASVEEMQQCLERIAATGRVASVDVMELNPGLDDRGITARRAVDLLVHALRPV